ncbi:hypothetical protein AB0C28_19095 [Nonomuraea sp. NPDC048892]|uniref:tetratricopeptide repeat protein n=1 Tax=Nonomuraea sp. NPDC048892 TaxID=3154624 RepID=UPI0033C30F96
MGKTKHQVHMLKTLCLDFSVKTDAYNVEQVVTLIRGLDPTKGIPKAATAYENAHKALGTAREAVKDQAIELAKVWEGKSSVEAQTALGVLYVTMGKLIEALSPLKKSLDGLGKVVQAHQAFIDDGHKGILDTWHNQSIGSWNDSIPDVWSTYKGYYRNPNGGVGDDNVENEADHSWGSQNDLAGEHLQTLSADLQAVFMEMPDSVESTLPDIKPPDPWNGKPPPVKYPNGTPSPLNTGSTLPPYGPPYGPGQNLPGAGDIPGGPGGPGNGTPNLPGTGDPSLPGTTTPGAGDPSNPGQPGVPGTPGAPNGYVPNGQIPTTTDPNGAVNPGTIGSPKTNLQDFQPTATNQPLGTTPPYGQNVPTTTGYNSPSTPSYGPGGGPGTFGGVGGVGGAMGPGAAGAAARGASGTGGMPFMPMGGMGAGAGGADQSNDRESTTWLHEDDDVWGGDSDSVVNGRIG